MDQRAVADLNTVTTWFQEAKPGDELIYHSGFLARDCDTSGIAPDSLRWEGVNAIARAADFLWGKSGMFYPPHRRDEKTVPIFSKRRREVYLLQRRVAPFHWDYIVVRS